jgi:hypothetical protein
VFFAKKAAGGESQKTTYTERGDANSLGHPYSLFLSSKSVFSLGFFSTG